MENEHVIRKYALQVKLLNEDDGGGFEALFPQLARSIVGYGETQQEAVDDLLSAVPAFTGDEGKPAASAGCRSSQRMGRVQWQV